MTLETFCYYLNCEDGCVKVKLKYWRIRRALSISDLARKAKMSTQTIVNIERYGTMPRPTTIRKIITALEITIEDLLIENEEDEKA